MGDEKAKQLWFLMAGRGLARLSEVGLQPRESRWLISIQKAARLHEGVCRSSQLLGSLWSLKDVARR